MPKRKKDPDVILYISTGQISSQMFRMYDRSKVVGPAEPPRPDSVEELKARARKSITVAADGEAVLQHLNSEST
jgi:hypothetical protein